MSLNSYLIKYAPADFLIELYNLIICFNFT